MNNHGTSFKDFLPCRINVPNNNEVIALENSSLTEYVVLMFAAVVYIYFCIVQCF